MSIKNIFRDAFGQLQVKVDSEASAQTLPQRIFSLQEEGEKEFFNFLKLLWGPDWLQLN